MLPISDITHALTTSTAAPSSSSASSTVSKYLPSSQASTSRHSNAGAIAGGVVGGIVFLSGVALGTVWFLLRRRGWKKRVANRRPVNLDEDDVSMPPLPTEGYTSGRTVTSPISSGRAPYVHVRLLVINFLLFATHRHNTVSGDIRRGFHGHFRRVYDIRGPTLDR